MKVNNPRFAEWLEKYRRFKDEAVQILTGLYREAVPKAMRVRRNNDGKQDLLIGEEGEREIVISIYTSMKEPKQCLILENLKKFR